MMSSSHSTNWRGISSSEVKSVIGGGVDSISTRAYSAAVRALKPKGSSTITSGNGIIIPKVSLKKKSPHQNAGTIGLKNSAGANFRTIQGKSSQSSQSNSKSHMHEAGGNNPRKSQQFGNINPISTISSNNSGMVMVGGPP